MQRFQRRSIAWSCISWLALFACSDGNTAESPSPGADCARDSDCNAELVCRFGRCHEECKLARDCEEGEMCVIAENGVRVCLLAEESSCALNSECPNPLVCAQDLTCRNECDTDRDCATETQKCVQPGGVCAEPEDIVGGRLRLSSGSHMDAGDRDGATSDGGMSMMSDGSTPMMSMDASQDATMPEMDAASNADTGAGGSAATGDGATGDSGSSAQEYYEDDTGEEPQENDTREQALPLPKDASIYVPGGDQDWFWFDTPDDGKAHYVEILAKFEQPTRVYIQAYAGADNSMIGSVLQEQGTTSTTYISAGPNTRTMVVFKSDRPGRLVFTWTMTTEVDDYEPNNDRDSAKPIELNTELEAQQIRPYVSNEDQDLSDWYSVDLQPGTLTFEAVAVPEDVGLWVGLMNPNNSSARIGMLSPGVIGSFSADIPTAGVYRLQVTNHSNSQITAFSHGDRPAHLSDSYTFKVTWAAAE